LDYEDGTPRSAEVGQNLAPAPVCWAPFRPAPQLRRRKPPRRNDARQFQTAMNLLAKARYDEASAAFRSFADTYPKDDLASQAVYWVADIAYVQKDYAGAARGFAEVIKKYSTSLRAPDSMLKLGQALDRGSGRRRKVAPLLPRSRPNTPKRQSAPHTGRRHAQAVCRAFLLRRNSPGDEELLAPVRPGLARFACRVVAIPLR